jgi:F-type H+-transporting ATPase subunit a
VNDQKLRIFGIPNRYLILAIIILGLIAARFYPPVLPHIQVAAERYPGGPHFTLPIIGEFYWTNTMTAMVIADIILLLIALAVRRAAMSGNLVPSGIPGVVEAVIEIIYNLTESTADKWTKRIFPFFATITLLVLIVNWTELIPGVDSIGFLEHHEHGNPVEQVAPGVFTLIKADEEHNEGGEHSGEVGHGGELFALVPYVRVLSTDLNFTVALALTSVFMTQVIGVQALGVNYFSKFLNLRGLWDFFKQPMGIIDFFVPFLEIVSEISKILSFSFRLFGNIFAGSVLLFVIGTLIPVVAQSVFLILELFVGVIQALVFGMLTMVFMSQATAGHGDHGDELAH